MLTVFAVEQPKLHFSIQRTVASLLTMVTVDQ